MTPGFNDSHVHFVIGGDALASVQLRDAASPAELRARVAAFAKTRPKGAWLRGGLWDHQGWSPAVLPTHDLIDDVTPDNPVMLWRLDGHMALANALAMKLAGVDRNTPDPPGGEIVRDATGAPTGIFKDAAVAVIMSKMPPLTESELDAALSAAMAEAARTRRDQRPGYGRRRRRPRQPDDFRSFQKLARRGATRRADLRLRALRHWSTLPDLGGRAPFGSDSLRLGDLKGFIDGALGSNTAKMRDIRSKLELPRPAVSRTCNPRPDEDDDPGRRPPGPIAGDPRHRRPRQPRLLDLFAQVAQANGPADRRFRIEHAQHLRPGDFKRFEKLGVIASMQPYHVIDDGRWAEGVIGHERCRSTYAWARCWTPACSWPSAPTGRWPRSTR